MTFGSLFAGIGGIDLGLERAGAKCCWQIEQDDFCTEILSKHWPEVPKYGDIKAITGSELEYVDLICGGFPCQDLSLAGKRAGIEGTRSGLWAEFARILGRLGPRWILIENVPGLLTHRAMSRVLGDLSTLGYDALWQSIRASDVGASHKRERIFIIGLRRELADSCTQFGAVIDPQSRNGRQDSSGRGDELADSPSRRRGVMREPSGRDGFVDGNGETLADAEQRDTRARSGAGESGSGVWRERSGDGCESIMADAGNGLFSEPRRGPQGRDGAGPTGENVPHAGRAGLPHSEQEIISGAGRRIEGRTVAEFHRAPFRFAPGPSDPRWPGIITARPDLAPALKPAIRRVADGISDHLDGDSAENQEIEKAMSNRMKRLSKIGNAVVPDVAEYLGHRIMAIEAAILESLK